MNMKTKPPCYDTATGTDCPRRYVGCKASCPAWHDYLAQHEREREEFRRRRTNEWQADSFLAGQYGRAQLARMRERAKERRREEDEGR